VVSNRSINHLAVKIIKLRGDVYSLIPYKTLWVMVNADLWVMVSRTKSVGGGYGIKGVMGYQRYRLRGVRLYVSYVMIQILILKIIISCQFIIHPTFRLLPVTMFPSVPLPSPQTLLDSFLYAARNIETVENSVVECGYEKWSYGDLDVISTGLAIEIKESYGLKPTIATFSENHPYILAVMLATWKLGGIYAPLDHHTPHELVQHMIMNSAPTFVVVPSSDESIKQLLCGIIVY